MFTMNSLFLGLLAAGVALVVAVIVYNWLQERRARRRIESAFHHPADVALDRERVEPQLRTEGAAVASTAVETSAEPDDLPPLPSAARGEALPDVLPATRAERPGVAPDADIECVVRLEPQGSVRSETLAGVLATRFAKPSRWLGRRGHDLPWLPVDAASSGPWQELAACLLLANRAGAASHDDVDQFLREVARAGAALPAAFALADPAAEAGRGEELDRFCADLDVQIGLTILKSEHGQIAGTRLRGVAEAAGFRFNAAGGFDFLQDDNGATLYSLLNYRQEALTAESLRQLSTPGVVLLLDVPRVADPVRVFDQMRLAAKRMAHTLEGVLVDDNRRPLDDAALASIRAEVQATAVALREANIEPGGPRALRLFG